jgi:quercetin dioxygenase-like cupin family protein
MTTQPQPYLNTREEQAVRFLGIPTLVRATGDSTNGSFALIEQWEMPPGFASPYHRHQLEDEAFYILEGEVAFVCDGKWLTATPGNFFFGPRGIPHGFKVVGTTPARILIFASPAGFDSFVMELSVSFNDFTPPDMAKLMAVAEKHKIDILGPLPE